MVLDRWFWLPGFCSFLKMVVLDFAGLVSIFKTFPTHQGQLVFFPLFVWLLWGVVVASVVWAVSWWVPLDLVQPFCMLVGIRRQCPKRNFCTLATVLIFPVVLVATHVCSSWLLVAISCFRIGPIHSCRLLLAILIFVR